MNSESEASFAEFLIDLYGPIEIIITDAISNAALIAIFIYLAIQSSRLSSSTKLPGTRSLAISCWFLVLSGIFLFIFMLFVDSDSESSNLYIVITAVTTIPIIIGGLSFGRFVNSYLNSNANKSNQSDAQNARTSV